MKQKNFELLIEGINYQWNTQFITGAEIRKLANLHGPAELFQAVPEPWDDQLVTEDFRVDLGRPETEQFYLKRNLRITINKVPYDWGREFITAEQIRKLGNVTFDHDIYLEIEKPGEDELVTQETPVNVALPGVEHFYSKESVKEVIIIVNGTPKKWNRDKITFKELIILAFDSYIDRPTMVYTVAYEDGPKQNPEGSMVRDTVVFVKNKMIFHATATDKS
jgi:hypothetical protein